MSQFDETVQDALTTVRLVRRWTLAPDEWAVVGDALREMDAAIAANDPLAVHRASRRLEANGPTRLSAIARSPEGTPAPEPPRQVLDLLNTLIHPDGGWAASPDSGTRRTPTDADHNPGGGG